MPEAVCCCQTCFDIKVILCANVPSIIVRNAITQRSYRLLLPEAICCCLQTCNCGFAMRCTSVPSLICLRTKL